MLDVLGGISALTCFSFAMATGGCMQGQAAARVVQGTSVMFIRCLATFDQDDGEESGSR